MLDVVNLLGLGTFQRPSSMAQWLNETSEKLRFEVNISNSQPPWLARPLYGFAAPLIILITLITNSFVVVVLSNKNLRTPTNFILLSMAVTELMTGLSSCPWFLYYYTFGGYQVDEEFGLPDPWCKIHSYFAVYLPTIFHTAAIWLTVYLAIQRYIYVCVPTLVYRFCCPKKTKSFIFWICIAAVVSEMPRLMTQYNVSVPRDATHRACYRKDVDIVHEYIGRDNWNASLLCTKALLVHILPCLLLIIFTRCLFRTVGIAERKRSVHQMPCRKTNSTGTGCISSNRLMHATTRMLIVVITIFLCIEQTDSFSRFRNKVPLAIIFIIHIAIVSFKILDPTIYTIVNNMLIIRNFAIILTYPLNFAIYFGMSSSFKLQFRQLFSRRILYVASPSSNRDEPGWRPRFSVQLIDIHKLRRGSRGRKSTDRPRISVIPLDANHVNTDEYL